MGPNDKISISTLGICLLLIGVGEFGLAALNMTRKPLWSLQFLCPSAKPLTQTGTRELRM